MGEDLLDVVGIGNAIVDVLAQADEALLETLGLVKGAMTLIDEHQAHDLYEQMGPAIECSGGSVANSLVGIASLGGRGGYIGKLRNDQLGGIFRHDIRSVGVEFTTPAAEDGPPSARCLVFVTPDAQRTMQTYLGACAELGPDDIDAGLVANAKITYLEGYLWDRPQAKDAFLKAASIAHQAGRKVALSLSDPFCVDRHRDSFLELVANHIDILFANEDEIKALYRAHNFDAALQQVRGHCEIAALTRSEKGSVVVTGEETHVTAAEPVAKIIDTTGAGDLFAAGFLYGITQGNDLAVSARIGGIAAAEIISHYGARPERSLADLLRAKLA